MSDEKPAHKGRKPKQKPLPIIYPDAIPDNANWLRILAQRRQQQQQQDKDKGTPPQQPPQE